MSSKREVKVDVQLLPPESEVDVIVSRHAEAIRVLGKRVARDVVEIGYRLSAVKGMVGHGRYVSWLEREFGWKDDTALNFIRVHELSKSRNFRDLNIPISGLYLLAKPSTSEEAQEAVIEKAKDGGVSLAEVKRMIEAARKKQEEEGAAYFERKIAAIQKKSDAEAARLREELSSALTPSQVKKAINEALEPLRDRIEKYKKAIERLERPKTKGDKIKDKFGTAPVAIDIALAGLVERMTVGPDVVIEHQKMISKATGQTVQNGLGQKVSNAKRAVAWLEKFLALAEEV